MVAMRMLASGRFTVKFNARHMACVGSSTQKFTSPPLASRPISEMKSYARRINQNQECVDMDFIVDEIVSMKIILLSILYLCRYHLTQEHIELINVHDWYQSFLSI